MAISLDTCRLIASFFSWGDAPFMFENADEMLSIAADYMTRGVNG